MENSHSNWTKYGGKSTPKVVSTVPVAGSTISQTPFDIDVTFSEEVFGVDQAAMVLSGDAAAGASVGMPIDLGGQHLPLSGFRIGQQCDGCMLVQYSG